MQKLSVLFSFLLVLLISCSPKKQEKNIPVEDFFVTPEKYNFRISPDGKYIAYIGLDQHCKNIFLLNLDHSSQSKQVTFLDDNNVHSFYWGSSNEIIFSNFKHGRDSLQLFAANIIDDSIKLILAPTKSKMRWVQPAKIHNNAITIALNERDSTSFDIYRIFLDGRPKQMILKNPGNIIEWYATNAGDIHVAIASDSIQESILYRPNAQTAFKEVAHNDFKESVIPLGFMRGSTSMMYVLSNVERDKLALVSYDVSEGKEVEKIYESQEVDLDASGYSYDMQEMMYASYTKSKQHKLFFQDKVRRIYEDIADKIGGFDFHVIDRDSALTRLIFRTYTDNHPGTIYYFDVQSKSIHKLLDFNPNLKDYKLANMEPVSYSSRDGKTINGYLTFPESSSRKNLPVIIMPHDGPHRRDTWGFQPNVQFLANRGYVVFQMNYRGSTGFGKEFWAAGFKQWGGKIQEDILDGVDWIINQGIADKQRIAIFGEGFGGYSALYAACFRSNKFACAASISGYTNLFTYFRDVPPFLKPYIQKFYQVIGNPETESDLFKAISPVFHADKVKIPVFLVQGTKDKNNSITDANQFMQKLQKKNIPTYFNLVEDEGRWFKNDENIVQTYHELEIFLKAHLGQK